MLGPVSAEEKESAEILQEIWRYIISHCSSDSSDPFSDTTVLEKLWGSTLGGTVYPALDCATLFQESFCGLDDLVWEDPGRVFGDLVQKNACGITYCEDEGWERQLEGKYETLVYLCAGGCEDSIKSRVFRNWEGKERGKKKKKIKGNSCFCPEMGSHLLFGAIYGSQYNECERGRRKVLRKHVKRMLVTLLQNGEDPEARCKCEVPWQKNGRVGRSVTDIAAEEGLLGVWESALVDAGYDTLGIIDTCLFDGLSGLFDGLPVEVPDQRESQGWSNTIGMVGRTILTTVSYVV